MRILFFEFFFPGSQSYDQLKRKRMKQLKLLSSSAKFLEVEADLGTPKTFMNLETNQSTSLITTVGSWLKCSLDSHAWLILSILSDFSFATSCLILLFIMIISCGYVLFRLIGEYESEKVTFLLVLFGDFFGGGEMQIVIIH